MDFPDSLAGMDFPKIRFAFSMQAWKYTVIGILYTIIMGNHNLLYYKLLINMFLH